MRSIDYLTMTTRYREAADRGSQGLGDAFASSTSNPSAMSVERSKRQKSLLFARFSGVPLWPIRFVA